MCNKIAQIDFGAFRLCILGVHSVMARSRAFSPIVINEIEVSSCEIERWNNMKQQIKEKKRRDQELSGGEPKR